MDSTTRQNLLGGILIVAALAIVLYAVKPYLPEFLPPPELPGKNSPITLQTTVKIRLVSLGGDPEIISIDTQKVSGEMSVEQSEIKIFPWGGKLVLDIIAPDGTKASMSKDVKIELGETKEYYFTWKTRQTGKHILVATLINGDGITVRQKQVEVWV